MIESLQTLLRTVILPRLNIRRTSLISWGASVGRIGQGKCVLSSWYLLAVWQLHFADCMHKLGLGKINLILFSR